MFCNEGLFSLAAAILVVAGQVSAEIPEEATEEGPWSDVQLRFLAGDVCNEIFLDEDQLKECEANFLNSTTAIAPDDSELQFVCRAKTSATYRVPPSKERHLVTLVPDVMADIRVSILKALNRIGTIKYIRDFNYTFWTTTLYKDGSHSEWRRGPSLPEWKENKINCNVEEPYLEYVKKTETYNAVFKINIVGALNPCTNFKVMNTCSSQVLGMAEYKIIRPNITANETQILVSDKDLPINDKCTLKIYKYDDKSQTPICEKKYLTPVPKNTHIAELATDVTLDAVATKVGWDITVGWTAPNRNPVGYNLTLFAPDGIRSIHLPGTETGHTFIDVMGDEGDRYNVTIYSYTEGWHAKKVGLAIFPPRPSFQAVIITGSWSVVMMLASSAMGALIWWRRRKTNTKRYIVPPQEPKISKASLMESIPESGVEDSWELRSERLVLHEVIGEGAFGVVRRGTLAPGGKDVAVKMMKDFPTPEEIRSFRAEMELMKSVGAHPHIVSLVGCCTGKRPLIVAEYCSRGDLLSFLRCSWDVMVSKRNVKYYNNNLEEAEYRNDLFKNLKDPACPPIVVNKMYDLQVLCDAELTGIDLLSFCRQIAMGMEFLSSNRVVHRDLAARNILVTADRTLKIADFGLSRDVYQENQYKQKGNGKIPVKWMALESLTHRIYTTQSDVWSFGVVIWEVMTVGAAPYPEVAAARLPRLLRAGYRMPRPNNCSKQLYELMMACWRAKPRERPTFAELHHKLDDLLNSACADEYLSLELDHEAPPTPRPQRYFRMILRGNRVWARERESYERPLKGSQINHYTTTPPHSNAFQHASLKTCRSSADADFRVDIGKISLDTKYERS